MKMKRFVCILLTTLLAMTCFFVAAGCESKEEKELREFKQQQIELFNQRIEETFAVQYDDSFPSPEYYEYYLSTIQKDTVEKIQNAATKEEAEKIMGDADSEIQIVSRYYNHYAQTIGFSVSNLENTTEIAEYNDGSLHLSAVIFVVTSSLSSGRSCVAARVTLPEGISAKVYYSNGLTFLTPQTDATFSSDGYPGSNAEKATSPFTVSAGDAEETYILLFDTTDPIIFDHKGTPSYNKDHDFYFSIIFEKDGFVTGYCLYNYFDKTTYDFRAIKTVVYGENYRGRVSEEKALGYIEQAKQGEDGEAADGIEYAEMGKLYVADRKNLFVYSYYHTYMKMEDKNRYFEIAYENSPDRIRIVLPKDLSSFTLSAQTGEFTLKGVTAKTVTPGVGDVVIYKNDSGTLDFISGVLQPALYDWGYDAIDPFIYNSFFCVFAVQPDGTAPYVPGTLAFKPLAVKYISFADDLADDSIKQRILKVFDIITRSAIEYHESEYLATL